MPFDSILRVLNALVDAAPPQASSIARQANGYHLAHLMRIRNALDDVVRSICQGMVDTARQVMGRQPIQETRVQTQCRVWYRICVIESRSTNQNCPFRTSHRPTRLISDLVAILE